MEIINPFERIVGGQRIPQTFFFCVISVHVLTPFRLHGTTGIWYTKDLTVRPEKKIFNPL